MELLKGWLPRLALFVPLGGLLSAIWLDLPDVNIWFAIFLTLFVLRYLRFIGHLFGHMIYRPSQIQLMPAHTARDVTVVVPTLDPRNVDFEECITSILANEISKLIVVTVGDELKADCMHVLRDLVHLASIMGTTIHVSAINEASKPKMIAHAMPQVSTEFTILCDDHIFVKPSFVREMIASFGERWENVGAIATKKIVRRTSSVLNFIASNYLERHSWELRASAAIDGGVSVISSKAAAYRTEFLADESLINGLTSEKFFFGLLGGSGLASDGDEYLTRAIYKRGWNVRYQDTEDATVETTSRMSFRSRATMRSNPVMLRDPKFLFKYTWSAFNVYLAALCNYAILWDAALLLFFIRTLQTSPISVAWVTTLVLWMIFTKTVKILPGLLRHPSDWFLLPFQILVGYIASIYKLWSLLTFWKAESSGRKLSDANADVELGDRQLGKFEEIRADMLLPVNL